MILSMGETEAIHFRPSFWRSINNIYSGFVPNVDVDTDPRAHKNVIVWELQNKQ